MIVHKEMDLFHAPLGSVLVHACNCYGVWGSGIAAEFAKRFPVSDKMHQAFCRSDELVIGRGIVLPREGQHRVGCLFTSEGFGVSVDPTAEILEATRTALHEMLQTHHGPFYSCKFNSGLFRVPWEKTEEVLEEVLEFYESTTWVVCDPGQS